MYQLSQQNGNKRVSQSNIFVKQCIVDGLFDLMEHKNFDDITITEVIKHAGVSRMGFYRNYNSKEDIIEKYILKCFNETIEEILKHRSLNFSISAIMTTTLEVFQKYVKYIKILLNQNMEMLMLNTYQKAFYQLYSSKRPSRLRDYSTRMFIGELFMLEIAWVRNGMIETPKQMAEIYYHILKLRINQQRIDF